MADETKDGWNFNGPEYNYLKPFLNGDDDIRKGFMSEKLPMGLNPDEMEMYKADGEDKDKDDKEVL